MRNHFRRGARFIADPRQHCRPLDRNERARSLFMAEALERRTKPAGGRNGVLGYVGLAVLKALVCGFLRRSDGMCCPSYLCLMAATGLCKQSIANALKRLEAAGILKITRRLVRVLVDGVMVCRQGSNLYSVFEPAKDMRVEDLPVSKPARAFPKPMFGALARLLGWRDCSPDIRAPRPWQHARQCPA